MKIELSIPTELIDEITEKVVQKLKPIIANNGKHDTDDVIYDVQGLAEYLSVSKKWIYEQTSFKNIPHYKLTNKQLRFKKKDIDLWLDKLKRPAMSEPTGKLRLISSR